MHTAYPRHIAPYLKQQMGLYPAVTVTGPRQSGKTTLVRNCYPDFTYVLLENPDILEFAQDDPRGFLSQYNSHVIFDEIQNAPHLLSYLQGIIDNNQTNGQFILTGSHQLSLNQAVTQSLAGRTALLRLLPLSLAELEQRTSQPYWIKNTLLNDINPPSLSLYDACFQGGYPRVHQHAIPATQFYRDYVDTYVTRDLRQLLQVSDLSLFLKFMRLLASRSGQILNQTSLGNDVGVDHTTVRRWISVLETSYIIQLIQPYHHNFNKRTIKSPKCFFMDSGLLCYLLRIQSADELKTHPLIGQIFETFIYTELLKNFYHQNAEAPLYFWRDVSQKEIDFLIDHGQSALPVEVKSAQTLSRHFFKQLNNWLSLDQNPQKRGCLIYGGTDWQTRLNIDILPWYAVS